MAPIIKICPKGHQAGTAFGGGFRCSGRSCGQIRSAERFLNPKPAALPQQMPAEEMEIQKRFKLAQLPAGGEVADPIEWAKDKLAKMLPEAVAQLQWDLRKGSDKVRSEAAERVLKANGMDKREASNEGRQPLIVVNIGADSKAPWLERLKKDKLP
jgi:hypothetical protein